MTGSAACEWGIRRRKICLLLLQEGLSAPSKKKFSDLCSHFHVDVLTISGYDRLGQAIGRSGIMVLGITDSRFAGTIKNY